MNLNFVSWLIFGQGFAVGVLVTMFFAYLKINGLRDSMELKDSRIRILQRQLEIASQAKEER